MTAGAGVAEDALDAGVGRAVLGQRRHEHFARQLPHLPLDVGHRL
jgi:hypothetical protein